MENINILCNLLGSYNFSKMLLIIHLLILCALLLSGAFILGKKLRKKYPVPNWYFWTAYIFVILIIATPLVLFLSCFIDNPKNEVAGSLHSFFSTLMHSGL